MRELLQNVLYGPGSYFQSNHMVVLVFGILLYFFVTERKLGTRERCLLRVTALLLALVLFPGSAAVLMLYQTRFYSYHWIWSLVPATLCIAWGHAVIVGVNRAAASGRERELAVGRWHGGAVGTAIAHRKFGKYSQCR